MLKECIKTQKAFGYGHVVLHTVNNKLVLDIRRVLINLDTYECITVQASLSLIHPFLGPLFSILPIPPYTS